MIEMLVHGNFYLHPTLIVILLYIKNNTIRIMFDVVFPRMQGQLIRQTEGNCLTKNEDAMCRISPIELTVEYY